MARLGHFIVAAVAVAGLGVALLSRRWQAESPELADWGRRYGVTWFMGGTLVQFLVGLWFLFSLPVEIRQALGREKLTVGILLLGIILALLALVTAPKSLLASSVAILGTVSVMAVVRHFVRIAYLRPYFDPHLLPVRGQWVVFSIFVVLLLAGLATVGWMLYVFYRPAATRGASS
jgi:membrane associated rhomboid family serine protease